MQKTRRWRGVRAGVLAVTCGVALVGGAAPAQAVYADAEQYAGAVWTNYPGGYFLMHMDPLSGGTPSASSVMSYWLQGVVNSSYCRSGSYANVYADGSLQVYTVTPNSASGTVTGSAYDSCAGFDRAFTASASFTVNGSLETTTNCCKLGYNYLVAERREYNGAGTATFQWASASTRDNTYMGGQYNNAGIGTAADVSTS
jgi:hypothetical protein